MKSVTNIFLVLILAIYSFSAKAQGEPGSIIPGSLMVQLSSLEKVNSIKDSFNVHELKVERILSRRLNIALLSYNDASILADELLSQVQKMPFVLNAQHDHVVQLREASTESVPNDPHFGLQWSLHNTGQSGGVPGADIDALQAWDITTGGLTAHGDTIVVAVIDSGCDILHPDLNLFKNWNEIPGNGIDDDNNGYVDDFHGWNAYNNTGNIPLSNHGTHVAGTVGARGNNALGVAGVNWNVKVLPIAGSSNLESTVVAAYAYAYDMRALYDETNGEYGAFIVATNSSFGVDFGQPQNYPIWGAMYDSLGTLGILNAAATANRNVNVDIVGDVPTAFPSPHIISVTNTTMQDLRNNSAAFGPTTIDLGAPGTQIYSTRNNNSYGYNTGTSMATPHVAGAIALLMAAADSTFIAHYKANPAEVALQLKQYILDGTDPLPSLAGITVSGGRLNVYNSMQLLLVQPPPYLSADPDTIQARLFENGELSTHINLANTGGDTLYFKISIEDNPGWVKLETSEGMIIGGSSLPVEIHLSSSGLEGDNYQANILVNTLHGQQHTTTVNLNIVRLTRQSERNPALFKVTVQPNPFSASTTFNIENPEQLPFNIQITDIQGRLVQELSAIQGQGSNFKGQWFGDDLQSNFCSNGMYFYRIVTDNTIQTGKILLHR